MFWRTHTAAGYASALAVAATVDAKPAVAAGLAAASYVGSTFPDADAPESVFWRARPLRTARRTVRRAVPYSFRPVTWPLTLLLWTFEMLWRAFAVPASWAMAKLGHRGATHTLAAASVVSSCYGLLFGLPFGFAAGAVVFSGVMVGYLSHLTVDAMTPGGVPALAPFVAGKVWVLPRRLRVPVGYTAVGPSGERVRRAEPVRRELVFRFGLWAAVALLALVVLAS